MTASPSRLRRTVFTAAKVVLAVAILAYLLHQAREHDAFSQLAQQPKDWPRLAAGLVSTFIAIALNFLRWHLLIGAVGISIKLMDTMRLASLGYALNFVSLGAIGGDLFKAIFLAHGQPGRRTEAVASVLADRVLGLMTFLLLASSGILAIGLNRQGPPALRALCDAILAAAGAAAFGAALVLVVPGLSGPRARNWSQRVPIAGSTIARLLGVVQQYRGQKRVLLAAVAVSLMSNFAYITSFYLVASGLSVQRPSYREHFVVVPVANMVGAIPVTPNGVGTKEAAVDLLYRTMPGGERIVKGIGTMVTLAHRITEMTVALLGLAYYLSHRKEVKAVYAEAEQVAEAEREEERDWIIGVEE
jgi:uncharacterized membrane protein YbhN (UPF0104 family)